MSNPWTEELSTNCQPKGNKIVNLDIERSADCPECGNKLWQIITLNEKITTLDDIKGIECSMCGFRVDFDEC